jgi:hypothetical protein
MIASESELSGLDSINTFATTLNTINSSGIGFGDEISPNKTLKMPLAISMNQLLLDTAQKEADATALAQQKKRANKTAAKYVVKIAANADLSGMVHSSASTQLLFELAAVCNQIARLCCFSIAQQFATDMIDLDSHQWISSIMRRPSTANSTSVQGACCHALSNLLELTPVGNISRTERQNDFINSNVHVAVVKTLGTEICTGNRDCVVSALKLASLLTEKNKAAAKRFRKIGAVAHVQEILTKYGMEQDGVEALTKIIVLDPAKKCLVNLWYGNKKKRKKGEAP